MGRHLDKKLKHVFVLYHKDLPLGTPLVCQLNVQGGVNEDAMNLRKEAGTVHPDPATPFLCGIISHPRSPAAPRAPQPLSRPTNNANNNKIKQTSVIDDATEFCIFRKIWLSQLVDSGAGATTSNFTLAAVGKPFLGDFA